MKNIYIEKMKAAKSLPHESIKQYLFDVLKEAIKSETLTPRQEDYLITLRKKLLLKFGLYR